MSKRIKSILAIIIVIALSWIGYDQFDLGTSLNRKDSEQSFEDVKELGEEVTISRVIDGDTVLVTMKDGTEERVRLLLIDTPESVKKGVEVQRYGKEASDFAKETLKPGAHVILEEGTPKRDKYDRLLAYLWMGNENFNELMIEEGYARVAFVHEPNTKYLEEFRKTEEKAKEQKLNIWSIDGYVTNRGFDMSVVD